MAMMSGNGGRQGRGRGRGGHIPMSEINVTPMVDVMLVLLVVFMISAPLMTAGVPVDLALLRDQRMIEVSVMTVDRARIMRRPNTH